MSVKVWTGNEGSDISKGGNWSGSTIPSNGDEIIIPAEATQNLAGDLDALSAVTLIGFTIEKGCSVNIGVRLGNTLEYFKISLKNSATYYNAELGGTGEVYLFVTNYHEMFIREAGSAPGTDRWAMNITGTLDADDTDGRGGVHVMAPSGTVSLAANIPVSGEYLETNHVYVTGAVDDLTIGITTELYDNTPFPIDVQAGTVKIRDAMTILTQSGGTVSVDGEVAVTTITGTGGTCYFNSDGTITTLNGSESHIMSFNQDLRASIVTNCVLGAGATIHDRRNTVTWTNGIDLYRCGIEDVTLDLGSHRTITPSAI